MDDLRRLIEAVQSSPLLGVGIAIAALAAVILLIRKPRMQRDADARLSALRRDNADRYSRLRPPH